MSEKSKRSLILSLIALILMLGVFIYLFIDLRREDNTYIQDVKVTEQARREAEATIFLGEAKSLLKKPFITILRGNSDWNYENKQVKNLSGWRLSLPDIDPMLLPDLFSLFENSGFTQNGDNSFPSNNVWGYLKDNLACIVNVSSENSVNIFCGYIN